MARASKKGGAKKAAAGSKGGARGRTSTRQRTGATERNRAADRRAPRKRQAAGLAGSPGFESLSNMVSGFLGSELGRAILADVLMAAAATLAKYRPGSPELAEAREQVGEAGRAVAEAGVDVASASRELARTAAGALTEVVADAARSLLPSERGRSRQSSGEDRNPSETSGGERPA
jgi:hypothetical protein